MGEDTCADRERSAARADRPEAGNGVDESIDARHAAAQTSHV